MTRAHSSSRTSPTRRSKTRWFVGVAFFLFLTIPLALALHSSTARGEELGDSIHFDHSKHVGAGAQCIFCHPGVLNGPVAGIPSVAKCVGCHQNVQVSSEKGRQDIEVLLELWEMDRPLRWEKVNDQPDFVYFAHRSHIAAGVNCENCHGNVSEMAMARQAYRINMGFCLDCHRQQEPEKVERLVQCATCHK